MYSSNNNMDFMSEMNRLFPKTSENEPTQQQQPFNLRPLTSFNSPIFNPAIGNQSSSSADSTSPESYPDITMPRCETPSFYRRQRPIVGRKIIPSEPRIVESPQPFRNDFNFNLNTNWNQNQTEESLYSLTPPNYPERYAQNEYELFPTEKKTEFQTPVKSSPRPVESVNNSPSSSTYSPSFSNYSPSLSNYSPSVSYGNFNSFHQTTFHQVREPQRNQFNYSGNQMQPFHQRSSQLIETPKSGKICTFCKKNGERPAIYMGHCLKERVNNKTVVQCPILRNFKCSTCGATGENAHTNTYCPTQRSLNNGAPLQSTTIILKNTRVKSNGRRRY